MKIKNFFVAKFIAVTMMLGLFSPSITIENMNLSSNIVSEKKIDIFQGILAGLTTTDISISLFTQAEARRGRGAGRRTGRRAGRRGGRRGARRANFRHGGGYRGGHHHGGHFVGGMVAGAIVGGVVSSAVRSSSCETVYVRGLRYQDCGNGLVRY